MNNINISNYHHHHQNVAESPPASFLPYYMTKMKKKQSEVLCDEKCKHISQQYANTYHQFPDLLTYCQYLPECSVYYNASMLPTFFNNSMIAQAPKNNLIATQHFFDILFQHKVNVVIRLNEVSAQSFDYTKGEKLEMSKYQVNIVNSVIDSDIYELKELTIKAKRSEEPDHVVVFFWFKDWPDHGLPNSSSLCHFILLLLQLVERDLVFLFHCLAGLGRSATFACIFLHILFNCQYKEYLQYYDEEEEEEEEESSHQQSKKTKQNVCKNGEELAQIEQLIETIQNHRHNSLYSDKQRQFIKSFLLHDWKSFLKIVPKSEPDQ